MQNLRIRTPTTPLTRVHYVLLRLHQPLGYSTFQHGATRFYSERLATRRDSATRPTLPPEDQAEATHRSARQPKRRKNQGEGRKIEEKRRTDRLSRHCDAVVE